MATQNKPLKGPRKRNAHTPNLYQVSAKLPPYQISLDKNAFEELIKSQGIRMVHYRALPNPLGLSSRGDTYAVSNSVSRQSSDNFIYKEAGTLSVLFHNNIDQVSMEDVGILNYASAYITVPSTYDDNKEPVLITPYDRFYFKDIETRVATTQLVESTAEGIDRLHYPATFVEYLIDSDNIEYQMDRDFTITEDGDIKWISQNRPGTVPPSNRGKIYAIRYRYTPFFVVLQLLHEIRVGQVTDPVTFKRYLERFPYQCLVVRERVFRDISRDPNSSLMDERLQYAPPAGGSLGPK